MKWMKRDVDNLLAVIEDVHRQQADDLCWLDIDRIFAAAGLPVPDRRVGDKAAMLANCKRYIDTMCEGGGWKSYAELAVELVGAKKAYDLLLKGMESQAALMDRLKQATRDQATDLATANAEISRLRDCESALADALSTILALRAENVEMLTALRGCVSQLRCSELVDLYIPRGVQPKEIQAAIEVIEKVEAVRRVVLMDGSMVETVGRRGPP